VKPESSKSTEAHRLQPLDAGNPTEVEPRNGRVATVEAQHLSDPDRIELSARIESLGRAENFKTENLIASSSLPDATAVASDIKQKKFWTGKKIAIAASLSVALIAGSAFGYQTYQNSQKSKADATTSPAVVTVSTDTARTQLVEDALSVTGSIWAWDPLSLGPEVSGLRITSINVEEGDHVKKGQVLATLNSALLRAQLDQAKARLNSSQANLNKSIQPNRPEDIIALRAMLAQAEATVAQEEAKQHQAHATLKNAEVTARRFTEFLAPERSALKIQTIERWPRPTRAKK